MNLTNTVYSSGIRWCRYPERGFPMLLARKGNPGAMNRVSANDIKYLCILLAGRLESPLTGRDVVKQVFNLGRPSELTNQNDGPGLDYSDLSAATPSRRFRVRALAWLRWSQTTVGVMSSPCTAGINGLRSNGQMGNVADARQRLSSKPIRPNGRKVFKSLELRRSEPFTKDGQIIFLMKSFSKSTCSHDNRQLH